jgi:formate-dependent nitrite reductase cytochrome c552 subunit
MAKNYKKRFRKFLNSLEHGGSAHVTWTVEIRRGYISAEFGVADCNDKAVLEFYVPKAVRKGKPRIENAKVKIDTMREAIDEFEKAFFEAVAEQEAARKKKRKKRKA